MPAKKKTKKAKKAEKDVTGRKGAPIAGRRK
jgi:hypothetical protein